MQKLGTVLQGVRPNLDGLSGHGFTGCGKIPNCCHPEPPSGVRDLLLLFAFVGALFAAPSDDRTAKSKRRATADPAA
jgi:hypothetical protein